MRILIIGAGPAGMGAAYQLEELGHADWHLYEAAEEAGGRTRPGVSQGFTYDFGQRYDLRHPYIERMLRETLGDLSPTVLREAASVNGNLLPMPAQQHVRLLDPALLLECIMGIASAKRDPATGSLEAWLRSTFGDAFSSRILEPYLRKYWAHPLDLMDAAWAPAVIPAIDLESVLRAVIEDLPAEPAIETQRLVYPPAGTAEPLRRIADRLSRRVSLGSAVASIDPLRRTVQLANGLEDRYDALISTMPLNDLLPFIRGVPPRIRNAALQLSSSNALLVGIGLRGDIDLGADRVYVTDPSSPFSRITHLSRLSPSATPGRGYSSVVAESSSSHWDTVDRARLVDATIEALLKQQAAPNDIRERIVDATLVEGSYTRPTPTIERDVALEVIQPYLSGLQIYSRGLAGSWLHEVGDLDQSFMQGAECVDRLLHGRPEQTWRAPAARMAEVAR